MKKSKVITFYSFKGGVGRSMALVNVATLLSSWGHKVLMVDWDLEAPGLENFFAPYAETLDTAKQPGMLDLLYDLQNDKQAKWQDYVYSFSTKISKTPLHLITSGQVEEGYTEKLRSFNVDKFYSDHEGGYLLENLRNEWLAAYDFVLIDSRTGVTDFGGICTIQMPDILVMLLTPTEQGLKGTIRIADRVEQSRRSLPFDREKLLVFPVPSRMDSTNEFEQNQRWVKRFAKDFEVFFDDWLPMGISKEDFLQRVKVPYIAYFSYGEKLPVIEQGMDDPGGLGYAYENLAMLIGRGLDEVNEFIEKREGYLEYLSGQKSTLVQKVIDLPHAVTISIFSYDMNIKEKLMNAISSPKVQYVNIDEPEMFLGMSVRNFADELSSAFINALTQSDVSIVVIDQNFITFFNELDQYQLSRLMKHSALDKEIIIPLFTKDEFKDMMAVHFIKNRRGYSIPNGSIPQNVINDIFKAIKYVSKRKGLSEPATEHTNGPTG